MSPLFARLMLATTLVACGAKTEEPDDSDTIDMSDGGDGGVGGGTGDGAGDGGGDGGTSDGGDGGSGDGIPDCSAADGAGAVVSAASIDGDRLVAQVEYSGGCADHAFELCWPDQSFMESEPVQVVLEVRHDTPGDPCEAWITETPSFDLTPLADSWRSAYGREEGQITIRFHDHRLDYRF